MRATVSSRKMCSPCTTLCHRTEILGADPITGSKLTFLATSPPDSLYPTNSVILPLFVPFRSNPRAVCRVPLFFLPPENAREHPRQVHSRYFTSRRLAPRRLAMDRQSVYVVRAGGHGRAARAISTVGSTNLSTVRHTELRKIYIKICNVIYLLKSYLSERDRSKSRSVHGKISGKFKK